MNRKRKWLLPSDFLIVILGLSALGALIWIAQRWQSAEISDKARRDVERAVPNAISPTNQASRLSVEATSPAVVQVLTHAPGMSASRIEDKITACIERLVKQAGGIRTITSRSIAGVSIIDILFQEDVDPAQALAQINFLIRAELSRLPPNAQSPFVTLRPLPFSPRWEEDSERMPAGVVTVTSPTLDEAMLRNLARISVSKRLRTLPGISYPVVLGGKDYALLVYLKPNEMEARHVALPDVATALRKANDPKTPMGITAFGANQFFLRTINEDGKAGRKISDLVNLPIRLEPNKEVYLRDIATLHDGVPFPTSLLRIDGWRGVCLQISFAPGIREDARDESITEALASAREHLLRERDIKLDWVPFRQPCKDGRTDDDGLLTIHLRAPSNLRLEAVEQRVAAFERFLEKNVPAQERLAIIAELGVPAGSVGAFTSRAGQQDATIRLVLARDRTHSAGEYARLLRSQSLKERAFADLQIAFTARDLPKPFAVRIQGGRPDQAMRLARELHTRAQAVKGTCDVFIVERLDAPCLVIDVDQTKAAQVGLTRVDVLCQAVAALSPQRHPLLSVEIPTGSMPWFLRYPEVPDRKLEDVLALEIPTRNQLGVKLGNLVSIRQTMEPIEIHRVDSSRVFHLRSGIDNRDRRDVIADIRKMIEELQVPAGMKVELVE